MNLSAFAARLRNPCSVVSAALPDVVVANLFPPVEVWRPPYGPEALSAWCAWLIASWLPYSNAQELRQLHAKAVNEKDEALHRLRHAEQQLASRDSRIADLEGALRAAETREKDAVQGGDKKMQALQEQLNEKDRVRCVSASMR